MAWLEFELKNTLYSSKPINMAFSPLPSPPPPLSSPPPPLSSPPLLLSPSPLLPSLFFSSPLLSSPD